jgi:hypothetical protein
MKKILLISLICTGFVVTSFAQDSNSKRLALGIYGGIQVPGYGDYSHLDAGPWFGITANIPTGLDWCIQFEYNFWKSVNNSREPDEDLYVSEFPLLIGYKWSFDKYNLQTLFGPGLASSGKSLFGGDRNLLVSFEVSLKFGLEITKDSDGFIQVRKQWSGSLNFGGGGAAYNPWLIGLGIQYRLGK